MVPRVMQDFLYPPWVCRGVVRIQGPWLNLAFSGSWPSKNFPEGPGPSTQSVGTWV